MGHTSQARPALAHRSPGMPQSCPPEEDYGGNHWLQHRPGGCIAEHPQCPGDRAFVRQEAPQVSVEDEGDEALGARVGSVVLAMAVEVCSMWGGGGRGGGSTGVKRMERDTNTQQRQAPATQGKTRRDFAQLQLSSRYCGLKWIEEADIPLGMRATPPQN